MAKAIHHNSDRRDAPFVPVKLRGDPRAVAGKRTVRPYAGSFTDAKVDKRGLFEEAQKGTLFLDEIGELPPLLQAKLLRAIQEREIRRVGATKSIPVDVRIIAATNLNLVDEVKQTVSGRLLLPPQRHRIRLPPLRERREDIPDPGGCVSEKVCRRSRQAGQRAQRAGFAMLADYAWPGECP